MNPYSVKCAGRYKDPLSRSPVESHSSTIRGAQKDPQNSLELRFESEFSQKISGIDEGASNSSCGARSDINSTLSSVFAAENSGSLGGP